MNVRNKYLGSEDFQDSFSLKLKFNYKIKNNTYIIMKEFILVERYLK